MCDYLQIQMTSSYGMNEWHDDLKAVFKRVAVSFDQNIVFLFTDSEVSVNCDATRITTEYCIVSKLLCVCRTLIYSRKRYSSCNSQFKHLCFECFLLCSINRFFELFRGYINE